MVCALTNAPSSARGLQSAVRAYAGALGSVRHLLADLTLPLLSVFSGNAFDETIRSAMRHGAQRIEDLWLPYFCVVRPWGCDQRAEAAEVHRPATCWPCRGCTATPCSGDLWAGLGAIVCIQMLLSTAQ